MKDSGLIMSMQNGNSFLLKIYILNEKQVKTIIAQPDEFAQDILDRLATVHLKCEKSHYFALSTVVDRYSNLYFNHQTFSSKNIKNDSNESIFSSRSIVEKWLNGDETLEAQGINGNTPLYFRIKIWKTPLNLDEGSITEKLYVEQIHTSLIESYFPYPERIAIKMAAYRFQHKFGDYNERKHRIGFLNGVGLSEYLPKYVSRHKYDYWQNRIFKIHKTLKGISQRDALYQYIECAKSSPYFGMTFFEVLYEQEYMYFTISEDGIHVFRKDLDLLARWPFFELKSWVMTEDGIEIELQDCMISFSMDSFSKDTAIQLLDEYFILLPDELKDPDSLPTRVPFMVTSSTDYDRVLQRLTLHRFSSRVEVMKQIYMYKCMKVPLTSFCNQIDNVIDLGEEYTTIDLSKEKLNEISIVPFTQSIVHALEYIPPDYAWIFRENLNPKILNISGNILPYKMASKLLEDLILNLNNIVELDISGSRLENIGAIHLSKILKTRMPLLEIFAAREARIGSKGFTSLIKIFKQKPMKSIDFTNNLISSSPIIRFLPQYIKTSGILEVKIGKNNIETKGLESLLPAIWEVNLQSIDLSFNAATLRCTKSLAKLIKNNVKIQSIIWSGNRMMGGGVNKIGRSLRVSKKLHTLDLSDTFHAVELDKELSKEFCKFMKLSDCKLQVLLLSNNEYGYIFMEILGKALFHNNSIKHLDISSTKLGNEYGEIPTTWRETLKSNTTLEILKLQDNNINTIGFRTIFRPLVHNSTLQELDVSKNIISEELLEDLRQFMVHTSVRILRLRSCKLKNIHLKCLIRKFIKSKTMIQLDITGNMFTRPYFIEIISKLPPNDIKKSLIIDHDLGISIEEVLFRSIYLEIIHSHP